LLAGLAAAGFIDSGAALLAAPALARAVITLFPKNQDPFLGSLSSAVEARPLVT